MSYILTTYIKCFVIQSTEILIDKYKHHTSLISKFRLVKGAVQAVITTTL